MHLSGDKKQEAALNFALPSLSALVSVALSINKSHISHISYYRHACDTDKSNMFHKRGMKDIVQLVYLLEAV